MEPVGPWAGCPTRRVPIFLRAIHRPPSIRDRRRSGKRQRPSVGFPPFFFAGIGQRSEKCDWPRREQLSFVVQVFRRCPFRTCVEFHTGRFPPSEIQFFESLNNQPLHGSYCLLVMPVSTPEKAYCWFFFWRGSSRCSSRSVQPVWSISMICSQGARWSCRAVAIRQLPRRDCAWRLRGDLR